MTSLIAITKAITASAVELKAVKIKHTLYEFKGVTSIPPTQHQRFFGNLLPFYSFGERAFVFVSTKKLNQDIIVWKIVGSIMRQVRKCRPTVCSKSSAVHFIGNKVFKPGQQQHETKSSKSCY